MEDSIPVLAEYLLKGDMKSFEDELYKINLELYNKLAFAYISIIARSEDLEKKAKIIAQKKGLGRPERSEVEIQLRTGEKVKIFSWYARCSKSKRKHKRNRRKRGPNGSGYHLLLTYWGCLLKATPCYFSYVAQLAILCPSFDIALEVMKSVSIQGEYKRIRQITFHLADTCFRNGRVKMILQPGETMKGKRVIISVDGGKSRMREYKEKKANNKRKPFNTPWREPRLFVIQIINEDGSISKTDLPIYDTLQEKADKVFELLAEYLKALKIATAKEILFIADGATWIWERVKSMLLSLGVDEKKIVEAIDYYHASEHLCGIIKELKKITDKEKKDLFKTLKDDLWNGRLDSMLQKLTNLAKGRKFILDKLNYFNKNRHRLQYDQLQKRKLPCGSGIVESAIRRVINLRFKSPSTFWKKPNLQKLTFLRGAYLSGRWNIMINNVISIYKAN